MKKLISIATIEALLAEKKGECLIASDTIITPAAIDLAEEKGIRFVKENSSPNDAVSLLAENGMADILQLLKNKEVLHALIASLKGNPYEEEQDASGIKIIRGKTVRMDALDEKNKNVCGQILFTDEQKNTEAGLLRIEASKFSVETRSEELNLILEGQLAVKINGKTYTAQEGDVVSIPAGIKVERSACITAKIFYVRS